MSWDSYIDDHLMCPLANNNTLTSAAIIGHDGSLWAGSSKFPEFKPEEIAAIMEAFHSEASTLPQHGLFIGGTKYLVVQGEFGAVIRGKKGASGVTVKKTNMCLVVGIYDDPVTHGECNTIVEKLGDYLIDQGY